MASVIVEEVKARARKVRRMAAVLDVWATLGLGSLPDPIREADELAAMIATWDEGQRAILATAAKVPAPSADTWADLLDVYMQRVAIWKAMHP